MDLGAAVSQKGYDVKNSADRLKVFSSSFQTLKIHSVHSVSTTVPNYGDPNNVITINHNLGYIAPFIVIYNGNSREGVGTSYFFSDSDGASMTQDYYDNCRNYANSFTLSVYDYWDIVRVLPGDTVYFTVYFFVDDFRTVAEDNITSTIDTLNEGEDYGFRVSKPTFDVKTCEEKDCVLSSSIFTQIVHKKGILPITADGLFTISQNLTYFPASLCFYKFAAESGINYMRIHIDNNNLTNFANNGDSIYYIIFKNQISA